MRDLPLSWAGTSQGPAASLQQSKRGVWGCTVAGEQALPGPPRQHGLPRTSPLLQPQGTASTAPVARGCVCVGARLQACVCAWWGVPVPGSPCTAGVPTRSAHMCLTHVLACTRGPCEASPTFHPGQLCPAPLAWIGSHPLGSGLRRLLSRSESRRLHGDRLVRGSSTQQSPQLPASSGPPPGAQRCRLAPACPGASPRGRAHPGAGSQRAPGDGVSVHHAAGNHPHKCRAWHRSTAPPHPSPALHVARCSAATGAALWAKGVRRGGLSMQPAGQCLQLQRGWGSAWGLQGQRPSLDPAPHRGSYTTAATPREVSMGKCRAVARDTGGTQAVCWALGGGIGLAAAGQGPRGDGLSRRVMGLGKGERVPACGRGLLHTRVSWPRPQPPHRARSWRC